MFCPNKRVLLWGLHQSFMGSTSESSLYGQKILHFSGRWAVNDCRGHKKGLFSGRELSFFVLFDSSVHRNGPFRGQEAVNDGSVHGNAGFGG